MLPAPQNARVYTWIRVNSIPATSTPPNSSPDMLYIRVWELWRELFQHVLSCVMAQGFGRIPEVDRGFGRNIREGHTRTIFQEGLKRKTELEIINGKTKGKVRSLFTECLHLLGTAVGAGLGKSPEKDQTVHIFGFAGQSCMLQLLDSATAAQVATVNT